MGLDDWERSQTELVKRSRAAFEKLNELTPEERMAWMVSKDLVCGECLEAVPRYGGHLESCSKWKWKEEET